MYWQVDNTNVRFLGSMHLLPAQNAGLPPWANQAFDWAEEVVFESDHTAIARYFAAPTPPNLQRALPAEAWATMRSIWPSDFTPLEAVRPWVAFIMLPIFAQKVAPGIEELFRTRAAEQGKPVHFLETPAAVTAALDSSPIADICQALEVMATDLTMARRHVEQMYEAWMRADLPALYAVVGEMPGFQSAGIKRAFLERRNREWVPALRRFMRSSKRTLVAVGALHFCGPGNIIECSGKVAHPITL